MVMHGSGSQETASSLVVATVVFCDVQRATTVVFERKMSRVQHIYFYVNVDFTVFSCKRICIFSCNHNCEY